MNGRIQIRVSKCEEDLWIGDLEQGSCFNAHLPFHDNNLSKVSFYSNSKYLNIGYLDIDEIFKLCQNDSSLIPVLDKLKKTKFKVKYNLLDDLDFFTFPRKYIYTNELA